MTLKSIPQYTTKTFFLPRGRYLINLSPEKYMVVIQERFSKSKLFPNRMSIEMEFYDITDQTVSFVISVTYGKRRYLVSIEGKVEQNNDDVILDLKSYLHELPLIIITFIPSLLLLIILLINYQFEAILYEFSAFLVALLCLLNLYTNIKRINLLIHHLT